MPAEPFLERLMNTYGDELLRMCFLYLKDYQLAEDAVQDTFLKAMKSYQFFQHQSSEKTWLTRIAINCCKNVIRTRWFRMRHVNMEADTESNHNDPIEKIVEKNRICAAIMALNASDRQIIVLYYYQELSVKEIAMIIGKSENTTIQRLNRARGKMKKILTEAGYDRERDRKSVV